jgi:hypothetical protein
VVRQRAESIEKRAMGNKKIAISKPKVLTDKGASGEQRAAELTLIPLLLALGFQPSALIDKLF